MREEGSVALRMLVGAVMTVWRIAWRVPVILFGVQGLSIPTPGRTSISSLQLRPGSMNIRDKRFSGEIPDSRRLGIAEYLFMKRERHLTPATGEQPWSVENRDIRWRGTDMFEGTFP